MMWTLWPLLVGCGVRLPDPVLTGVEPDRGWNGEETILNVEGANFFPEVEVNANRRDRFDFDQGFQAMLRSDLHGEYGLVSVSAVDFEQLRAVVGPGIPSGLYDLVVVSPSGREGVLSGGFTVSDTRADRLELVPERVASEVNSTTDVQIQLLSPGPDPDVVAADLEVELQIDGLGGTATDARITGTNLVNAIISPAEDTVTGFLGPDGVAAVSMTVATPGSTSVAVRPLDPTSAIRDDELTLQWDPGQDLQTLFVLPSDPFQIVAGEPFDVDVILQDQFGNPVDDDRQIVVQSSCGSQARILEGPQTVEFTLFESTEFGNGCADAPLTLRVLGSPAGESEPIRVLPAAPAGFTVATGAVPIRAGETKSADIIPRDVFDNRTLFTDPIAVSDTVGGLVDIDCIPSGFNDVNCRFISTRAGDAVQLVAESGPLVGVSSPYRVDPSLEIAGVGLEALDQGIAGQPTPIAVMPVDPFGNLQLAGDVDPTSLAFADEFDEVSCVEGTVATDGRAVFDCTFFTARTASLLVQVGGFGASTAVEVINGPIGAADVQVPAAVVAGETFTLELSTFDVFGNAYQVQTVSLVDVVDASGLVLATVPLDAAGMGSTPVRLIESGTQVLSLVADGVTIGMTPGIVVAPDTAVEMVVRPLEPWAWMGVPTAVRIETVDTFGNRGDENIDVVLSADSGRGDDVLVSLVNGAATTSFVWDLPVSDDFLAVTGGGLTGASAPIDIASDCGAAGPSAVLTFGGAPTGRACEVPGVGGASVTGSLAGSTSGVAPIERFRTWSAVSAQLAPGPAVSFEVAEVGVNDVRALVIDTAGCGSEVEAEVWVGPDDGHPVGPLSLTLVDPMLEVGLDSTIAQVVAAVDCHGDPASGGQVRVRTDRGRLGGTSTGAGLVWELDGTGSATNALDVLTSLQGGEGALLATSVSGGAAGSVRFEVTGDLVAPFVLEQTPHGESFDPVDEVVLTMSESLDATSLDVEDFAITGPSAVGVAEVELVQPDRIRVGLDSTLDPSLGAWMLEVQPELMDAAGNRLTGDFSGLAGPWSGEFGAVPGVVDAVTCASDVPRFRPDGDDGPLEEADRVQVFLDTASLPRWWRITVVDSALDRVRRDWLVPAGTVDVWAWDGRDGTGRIVDDGTYAVRVEPVDVSGNAGEPCAVSIQVDNEGTL